MKYVTIDNVLLEAAESKVNYDFEYEFVGRKLKDNFQENYDVLEREYFESETFLDRAITFSCEIKTDNDGFIKSVEAHKFRDKYFGHGRPVVEELKLSKKDENAIRKCINGSVLSTLDDEYNALIERVKERDTLLYDYRLNKCTTKGIILDDKKNNSITVNKESIKKSLALSHVYLDILYDEILFKENEDLLNKDVIKPLLAITSYCDYSGYHDLDKLQKEVERRQTVRDSEKGYTKLIKAIKTGNAESVKKYAKYSVVYDNNSHSDFPHPLFLAIIKRPEYVDVLLSAGSYANPRGFLNKSYASACSALSYLYDNLNYIILQKLANCYNPEKAEKNTVKPEWGETNTYKSALSNFTRDVVSCLIKNFDINAASVLLPHTYEMKVYSSKFSNELSIEQIECLSSFNNIRVYWERRYFEKMYPVNRAICVKMVEQGCELDSINYFLDINALDLYKTSMEKWMIHQNYLLKQESYNLVFSRDPEWHDIAKSVMWRSLDLDNNYLSALFETDRDLFEENIKKYNLRIEGVYSVRKYLSLLLSEKDIKRFKAFVKNHDYVLHSSVFGNLVQSLEYYSERDKEDILSFIYDNYGRIEYTTGSAYQANLNHGIRDHFVSAVYKHGTRNLIDKLIDNRIIGCTKNINDFINCFKENYYESLRFCNGYACNQLINKVLKCLQSAAERKDLFEGPYSDRIDLAIGEIYRTIRNLWSISGYEWPINKEINNKRLEIVRNNMSYYVFNVDLSILCKKGGLYDWTRNASSSVLGDLGYFHLESEDIKEKVIHDFENNDNTMNNE